MSQEIEDAAVGKDYDYIMREDDITFYTESVLKRGPRRFALIGLEDDRSNAGVVGWGLDFGDTALFLGFERTELFRARSAEAVQRIISRAGHTRLAWLDPEPKIVTECA